MGRRIRHDAACALGNVETILTGTSTRNEWLFAIAWQLMSPTRRAPIGCPARLRGNPQLQHHQQIRIPGI